MRTRDGSRLRDTVALRLRVTGHRHPSTLRLVTRWQGRDPELHHGMRRPLAIPLAPLPATVHAGTVPRGWTTYRSEQFGWELSYPPDMELKTYLGGASGELRDAKSGTVLAELEVWPADLCP